MSAPVQSLQPTTIELMARESDAEIARVTGLLFDQINESKALKAHAEQAERAVDVLEAALLFYADPFAWKKKHDPGNDVRVPDFYSETSFGDTAIAALSDVEAGK